MRDSAVDAGAKLFDKNISTDFILKDGKRIGIKTKSPEETKEYYGKIFIIAEGMSSRLAIKSGLRKKWKIEEIANAKCAIMEGENNLNENLIYIYFKPYKGYGWIFPMGKNRFNIGVYTFSEDNLKYNLHTVYNEFLNNPNIQKYVKASKCKIIWSGAYPFPVTGILDKSLYDDNLFLVGDVGGFISPINGEGIHTAIASGKAAAEIAIDALEKEDYSKNVLRKYKTHPDIKEISRTFKLKSSLMKFFYENKGRSLNRMLEIAEQDDEFREQVLGMFISKSKGAPPKEFFLRISS